MHLYHLLLSISINKHFKDASSYSLIFTIMQSFFPLFSFLQHLIWEIFKQIFMTFSSIIIIEESLSNWGTNCGQSRDIHAPYHAISPATFANTSCGKSRDICEHIMQSGTRHSCTLSCSKSHDNPCNQSRDNPCNQSRDIREHIMQ